MWLFATTTTTATATTLTTKKLHWVIRWNKNRVSSVTGTPTQQQPTRWCHNTTNHNFNRYCLATTTSTTTGSSCSSSIHATGSQNVTSFTTQQQQQQQQRQINRTASGIARTTTTTTTPTPNKSLVVSSIASFIGTRASSSHWSSSSSSSRNISSSSKFNNNNIGSHREMASYSRGSGGRGSGGRGSGGRGSGGRGEYYKNRYGGGGRGGGRGSEGGRSTTVIDDHDDNDDVPMEESSFYGGNSSNHGNRGNGGGTYRDLQQLLQSIDGRQYPNYHDLETGSGGDDDGNGNSSGWVYYNPRTKLTFTLYIGRTQSDPFAPPTRCRIVIPTSHNNTDCITQPPDDCINTPVRRMATSDYLWRLIYTHCISIGADRSLLQQQQGNGNGGGGTSWSGPKGGDVQIMEPTQHVIDQSAVYITDHNQKKTMIVCQLTINLPARGRSILGNAAFRIFDTVLPDLIHECFVMSNINIDELRQHVNCIDDQTHVQNQLKPMGLIAFIRNGAILPRRSGVDDRPMIQHPTATIIASRDDAEVEDGVVQPFQSPKSMEVTITLPNSGQIIHGMGIPMGITLICGGGYHGKSTILETIQYGIYCKVPNDGRDYCMTSTNAMKIRAEDGRHINCVDISSFISNIPSGKETVAFTSFDASGSTSQASNIVEAIELGADVLLMDEDTCATNFMIRDQKMMQLVAPDKEPITPYIRLVQSLKDQDNISTILVVGGTGDYFDVADHVLVMDSYRCEDATIRAKQIAVPDSNSSIDSTPSALFAPPRRRYPILHKMKSNGRVKVLARNIISYGEVEIDLSMIEQIVSKHQANAIASIMQYVSSSSSKLRDGVSLNDLLDELNAVLDSGCGLSEIQGGSMNGSFVRPRKLEVGAAINRLRINDSIVQKE